MHPSTTPAAQAAHSPQMQLFWESIGERCAIKQNGSIVASGLKPDVAKQIVGSVNAHDKLINALQSAESILTVDFATPDTVEGRRALSFVNSLRTLLASLN